MKRTALVPLLLLATFARAVPLKLKIVGALRFTMISGDAPPDSVPEGPYLNGPTTTLLEAQMKASTGYFIADDGSVVARSWADLSKDPVINFTHPTHLARITVQATRGKEAVAAVVELKDLARTQRVVLGDSSSGEGRAVFTFVRIGEATLSGRIRGANNATEVKSTSITVSPAEPPTYTLDFAGGPATPSPPPSPSSTPGTPSSTTPTGAGFFSNLVSVLLGLLVAGGAAFALWTYAKKNPDRVKQGLQKIGADVPEPPEPAPDPVPAAPSAPEPPSQILLDPALADPIAVASVPRVSAPIQLGDPTGTPTLVAADGSVFDLPEGETIVGREAIGGLMLSHESVSRRHARLLRTGSQVTVEDLGSTNGTFVDGRRLSAPEPLLLGQSLRFGALEYALRG